MAVRFISAGAGGATGVLHTGTELDRQRRHCRSRLNPSPASARALGQTEFLNPADTPSREWSPQLLRASSINKEARNSVPDEFRKAPFHASARPALARRCLPAGIDSLVSWRGAVPEPAIRLSRCRPVLLSALRARAEGMGVGPLAALGARGEWRDALAGQPDGGRALSGQADLCGPSLCLGSPALRGCSHRAGIRGAAAPDAVVGIQRDRFDLECPGVFLRGP